MSHRMLWLIILIEGFVTISAEILTIRQLLPVVGNSVIVTSLIIGVFLLFLAYGYRRGGQYKDKYQNILKVNFTKSAIWLGLGLSTTFILLFFSVFMRFSKLHTLAMLVFYLLLITAPLVYLLGQTVPITMNLIKQDKQDKNTGAIGGTILHWSTLGSFLGAVLTSLLLMNYLGVAWTVFINFCLLMILTFLLFSGKKQDFLRGLVLCFCLIIVFVVNIHAENKMFVLTNSYADYSIKTDARGKMLMVNNSGSSLISFEKKGFEYIELIKRILFTDLNLQDKDILVLGAGGFSLSAEGTFGNRFTYVDIDKEVEKIAKTYFLEKIAGEFVVADARVFLNATAKKYDVIVSDIYSNYRSIPLHLITREYFEKIKQKLQQNGFGVFNVIARPTLEDEYSWSVDNTLRSVFPQCMAMPVRYTNEVNNIIYVCKKGVEKSKDRLYTDNFNQAMFDFFKSITQ